MAKLDSNVVEQSDPIESEGAPLPVGEEQSGRSNHWEVRTQEQQYAFLPDQEIKEENRYGQKIDLVDLTGLPAGRSMFINENPEVGSNPNRNNAWFLFYCR